MDKFYIPRPSTVIDQLTPINRFRDGIRNQLGVLDILAKFTKDFGIGNDFTRSYAVLSPFDSMLREVANRQKFIDQADWVTKPLNSIIEQFKAIQLPQSILFDKLNIVNKAYPAYDKFHQINNLQIALGGISALIAKNSILSNNQDLLEGFEIINEDASEINTRIIEQQSITKQDIDDLRQLIKGLDIRIDRRESNIFSKVLIWIAILTFIWDAFSVADRFIKEDDSVTKKEFEDLKRDLFSEIKKVNEVQVNKLAKQDVRRVDRKCFLRLRPNKNSLIIRH